MSEELNNELIKLYKSYKSQETPPDLMITIKSFLIDVEGINPDESAVNKMGE